MVLGAYEKVVEKVHKVSIIYFFHNSPWVNKKNSCFTDISILASFLVGSGGIGFDKLEKKVYACIRG